MYPPFLTSMLTSKGIHSQIWKVLLRAFISSREIFIPPNLSPSLSLTEVILASSTPITEENTKLLDCLSEPSSQLIHCISHPPEGDISAEVVTLCFICVQIHGFSSYVPTF